MTEAAAWLRTRSPAPPALRSAIADALRRAEARGTRPESTQEPEAGERPLEDRLAAAALSTLREVVRGAGRREGAARLLAADALLTYACEAAAERSSDALEALTARLALGRFEDLLPADGS